MTTIPLEPDEDTARDWLLQELSKAEYAKSRQNPFDEFVNNLWNWFASLFQDATSGLLGINPAWLFIILGIIAVVVLVVVFGRPRAVARRSAEHGSVFLEDDARSAGELRAAASAAAAAENWSLALVEQYRAIARSLSDRTLIRLQPGTTAQGVALAAAEPFEELRAELVHAARAFDNVRYAAMPASREQYELVRGLDQHLQRAHPQLHKAAVTA